MGASESFAPARDAKLCVQAFGDPSDPPVLLIQGAASSMDWWEDEFCGRLAAGGRFVVRYDHRDTGQSTTYPPGEPSYTSGDLAADVVAVLDHLAIGRAHLVGLSMGGALAQVAALDQPERVRSLTLVATSPVGPSAEGLDLPGMSDELAATFADGGPEPDWADRDAAVEAVVDSFRPYAGSLQFDEAGIRAVAERVADRTIDLASAGNHFAAAPDGEPAGRLEGVTAPTLVVHGSEDPLLPLPHGEALARLIPGARLLVLDRVGHELPRAVWDTVIPAILSHTSGRAVGDPGH